MSSNNPINNIPILFTVAITIKDIMKILEFPLEDLLVNPELREGIIDNIKNDIYRDVNFLPNLYRRSPNNLEIITNYCTGKYRELNINKLLDRFTVKEILNSISENDEKRTLRLLKIQNKVLKIVNNIKLGDMISGMGYDSEHDKNFKKLPSSIILWCETHNLSMQDRISAIPISRIIDSNINMINMINSALIYPDQIHNLLYAGTIEEDNSNGAKEIGATFKKERAILKSKPSYEELNIYFDYKNYVVPTENPISVDDQKLLDLHKDSLEAERILALAKNNEEVFKRTAKEKLEFSTMRLLLENLIPKALYSKNLISNPDNLNKKTYYGADGFSISLNPTQESNKKYLQMKINLQNYYDVELIKAGKNEQWQKGLELLVKGANISPSEKYLHEGEIWLTIASKQNYLNALEALIKNRNIDIDATNENGFTASDIAIKNNSKFIAFFLIKNRATIHHVNGLLPENSTLVQDAIEYKKFGVLRRIKNAGIKFTQTEKENILQARIESCSHYTNNINTYCWDEIFSALKEKLEITGNLKLIDGNAILLREAIERDDGRDIDGIIAHLLDSLDLGNTSETLKIPLDKALDNKANLHVASLLILKGAPVQNKVDDTIKMVKIYYIE